MNLTLKVWRQKEAKSEGKFVTYAATDVIPDMSFLEMLDVVNEGLMAKGEEPIAFDYDCLEGICGTCSMMIDGLAHGGRKGIDVLSANCICGFSSRRGHDRDRTVAGASVPGVARCDHRPQRF